MSDNVNVPEDTSVTFHVKSSGGSKYTLTLPLSTTTSDLKKKLSESEYANVPADSQRLIYSGKVLKDNETLATYNVKEGNTMHLVKSAASNQRQNPVTQSSTLPTDGTGTAPAPPAGVPQNLAAGTGNDPLAGLTGARFAGFHGLPSLESLANPPTPDDMVRRLQDPHFAQQMNEALQNPQMIDMMINMNPQLRAMGPQARQILQSDHFRRMMTNPEALRSMIQMQSAMGGNPFGMGGGGEGAFPMPGATNTTDQQHQGQDQNQQQQNQQNPMASLFGPGGMGMNPFMFNPAFQQPTGQTPSQNPSATTAQQDPAANPFAALFNPAMFGQPQTGQPQGQGTAPTGTTTTTSNDGSTNTTQQPPNPFANNPFLGNMQNNPFLQNLANNPEAMQNMLQMLGGGGGGAGGGMGGGDPMGMFGGGGFGQPPDNRPPEERYSTQLRQLNEMGFHDFDRNIQALTRSGGDVNGALEWLFSQP